MNENVTEFKRIRFNPRTEEGLLSLIDRTDIFKVRLGCGESAYVDIEEAHDGFLVFINIEGKIVYSTFVKGKTFLEAFRECFKR